MMEIAKVDDSINAEVKVKQRFATIDLLSVLMCLYLKFEVEHR